MSDQYLAPKQVAEAIGVSEQVLYRMRKHPTEGPPWRRIGGRIFYLKTEFEDWRKASVNGWIKTERD